jgi:hypothetical protein
MSQWSQSVNDLENAAIVARAAAGLAFGTFALTRRSVATPDLALAAIEAADVGLIVAIVAGALILLGCLIYIWQARSYSATIKRVRAELASERDSQIKRVEQAYEQRLAWMKRRQDALSAQVTILTNLAMRAGSINAAEAAAFTAPVDPEQRLYESMLPLFELDDLRAVAFKVGIRWDSLAGETVGVRLIELINMAKHEGRFDLLEREARAYRPNME